MNRQQVNTLLEILAGLQVGDNTMEQPLLTSMKEFYATLLANREGKTISAIQQEFDKKVDLLRWKLCSSFRELHSREMAKMNKKKTISTPLNEKEYSISEVAKKFNMTSQNLNQHLRNNKDIKIRIESTRKRYISESELERLKQKLGNNSPHK